MGCMIFLQEMFRMLSAEKHVTLRLAVFRISVGELDYTKRSKNRFYDVNRYISI